MKQPTNQLTTFTEQNPCELLVSQMAKKFPIVHGTLKFIKAEEKAITGPYQEPAGSILCPHIPFL
jgi:hypothetical protein